MKNILCLLLAILAVPARASVPPCYTYLTGVSSEEYASAVAPHVITLSTLEQAEASFVRGINDLSLLRGAPNASPLGELNTKLIHTFVQAHIRGFSKTEAQLAAQLTAALQKTYGAKINMAEIMTELVLLARRRDIAGPFVMAEFLRAGYPSVEAVQVAQANWAHPNSDLDFGPRHAEMVRLALQYGLTKPGDRILELGFGSPTVLSTLRQFLPSRDYVGLDIEPVSKDVASWAQAEQLNLLKGNLLIEGDLNLSSRAGAFELILALDTLNRFVLPDASGEDVLVNLAKRLKPSGSILVLNDYDAPPIFTLKDVTAAGLSMVTGAEFRDLPASVIKVIYPPGAKNPGRLRAYVLRKGFENLARVSIPEFHAPR